MMSKICSSKCAADVIGANMPNLLSTLSELLLFSSMLTQCETLDAIEKLIAQLGPTQQNYKGFLDNALILLAKTTTLQVTPLTSHSSGGL